MYFKNEEDIFKTLNSNIDGLDSKEAKKRLNDYGQNIILNKKKTPLILRFLKQFNDTMIIILLVVAVLLYFYGCFYSHEYTDTIVILFVVFINAIVGFIQEEKSALILKDLKKYFSDSIIENSLKKSADSLDSLLEYKGKLYCKIYDDVIVNKDNINNDSIAITTYSNNNISGTVKFKYTNLNKEEEYNALFEIERDSRNNWILSNYTFIMV